MIVPPSAVKNRPEVSSTCVIEKDQPCSYCIMMIERGNPTPKHFDFYAGPDCMEKLLAKFKKISTLFVQSEA